MPDSNEALGAALGRTRAQVDAVVQKAAAATGSARKGGRMSPFDPLAIAKAARVGAKPAGVRHHMSDAAKRYALMSNGIIEDASPHLDAALKRRLAFQNPIIRAVLNTKTNQVLSHFKKPTSEKSLGWRVTQRDTKNPLTPNAARRARYIEDVLERGGMLTVNPDTGEEAAWDANGERTGAGLQDAVKMLIEDSFVLDSAFLSKEGSAKRAGGKRENPVMFWTPEDGALIRRVDRKEYVPQIRPEIRGQARYVMLDPTLSWTAQREYLHDEGALWIRNRRTDQATMGYGYSELEQCLDAVMGLLYASHTNKAWFTDSHIPQGILAFQAGLDEEALEGIRLMLSQDVGLDTPYTLPIIDLPPEGGGKVNYIPFIDRTRMDMVFRAYAEWCVALVCSVFLIAPEEISFGSFGRSQAVLSEADPESLIQQSQHKGLLPLVLGVCQFLSRAIVDAIDPDFELTIQGLDERYNPELLQKAQLDAARLQNGLTLNQVKALNDEDPIYDPLDVELWRQIEEKHQDAHYVTSRERLEAVKREYQAQGGKLGSYPDAPTNPVLYQIWQQEHQGAGQAPEGFGEQAPGYPGAAPEQAAGPEQAGAQGGFSANSFQPAPVEDAGLRKSMRRRVIVIAPRGAEE